MEIKDLLPLGTVVLLKEASKKLMIVGYKPIAPDAETEYDYIGVLFPEGFIGNNSSFLFNHEDINDTVFIGYVNPEYEEFIDMVSTAYEEKNAESSENVF